MTPTRRQVLGTITAGVSLSVGGCLGDSDGGATPSPSPSETPTATSPPRAAPDALSAPSLGDEDSSVVVRAWEDFGCPHCRTFNERVTPQLEEDYLSDGLARYEHHDYPIPASRWSWPTAVAARGVQSHAGEDAFWSFAETAFELQDELGWSTIRDLADEAGAPADTVVEEAENDYWRPVVEADKGDGSDRGVRGTPTVFVNDYEVPFGESWSEFYENIAGAIDDRRDG